MARTSIDSSNKFDNPSTLMVETKSLLAGKDLLALHRETAIPYHWLCKFAAGRFQNPSVNRVQYLYETLTGKKILRNSKATA